jgi:hypothetical protein
MNFSHMQGISLDEAGQNQHTGNLKKLHLPLAVQGSAHKVSDKGRMDRQRSTEMKLMEVRFQAWLHGTGVAGYNLMRHQQHLLSIIYPLDQLPSYASDQPQIGKSL